MCIMQNMLQFWAQIVDIKYIEGYTSYFTARRKRDLIATTYQEITIEWWENALHNFELFVFSNCIR